MADSRGVDVARDPAHGGSAIGTVVLGMGRSGTSAVTRTLVESGFFVAVESQLMEADARNPVGYWENKAVFRANEEILERLGVNWFVPPKPEAQLTARAWAVPQLQQLLQRLMAEAGGAPLAVKDPRIGILLKLWGPVIDGALHAVLVVRNPVEIARSIVTIGVAAPALALASWELHTAQVLEFLNGRVVTVVPYASLVRSPDTASEFVAAVAARLREECASRVDPRAAPHAIEPMLHHEHARSTDLDEQLTNRQGELWRFLESLAPGDQVLDVPGGLARSTPAADALIRYESSRGHQNRELEGLRAQVARYESARVDAERKTDSQRARADSEQVRADAAEYWLRDLQASASWRLTMPLRTTLRALRHVRAASRQSRSQ